MEVAPPEIAMLPSMRAISHPPTTRGSRCLRSVVPASLQLIRECHAEHTLSAGCCKGSAGGIFEDFNVPVRIDLAERRRERGTVILCDDNEAVLPCWPEIRG